MADNQLVVSGPRKRKPNRRFADNGDPVPLSRKKNKSAQDPTTNHIPSIHHRHTSSQESGEDSDTNAAASARKTAPSTTPTTGSDIEDDLDNGHENPIDVDGAWDEPLEENADDELGGSLFKANLLISPRIVVEQLMKQWNTPVYAFFRPTPAIEQIDGRRAHIFECSAKVCKGKGRHGRHVRHYLNTANATSTSNLRRHAKICWGADTVAAASIVKDVYATCAVLAKPALRDGSITAAFERVREEQVTFSHRQHTRTESR